MKKACITILLLFAVVTIWSQNTEYYSGERFHIDTALTMRKNYVFTASDEILLDSAFQRNSRFTNPNKYYFADFIVDKYGVFPPSQGLQGGSDGEGNGYVGAIGGVIDVGKLGGAVYAIPIELPQGVNGMQPDLSLLYNSQAKNGLLGWCWDLAGLSAITRTGKTRYHDSFCGGVTLDDYNDRFLLDGMRLIRCFSYGHDSIMYKTEQDDMSRIVAYTIQNNGNTTIQNFRVWKADGTIVEYGFDNEHTHSRIEPQTGSDKALCWLVNKISDRNGNAMEFFYSVTQETGEYYVDHIDYTSNEKCGIRPAFQIVFQYESTHDSDFCFVAGNILQSKKVLKNISVQRADGTTHQMARYSFEYEPKQTGDLDYLYDSVNMFKRLRNIAMEKDGKAVNPTRIEWSCYSKDKIDVLERNRRISPNIYQNFPFVGDFNGDGFSDLAVVPFKGDTLYYPDNIDIKIHFNKGGVDSVFYGTPGVNIPNIDKSLDWIYVLDINDDGFDDIVTVCYDSVATGDTTKIMVYNNSNGTGFTPVWEQPLWFTSKTLVTIGDFEGTGKQGFIACASKNINDTPRLSNFTYVHCENGWCFADAVKFSNGVGDITGVYQIASGDFSGRAHTDLLFLKENASTVYGINKASDGSYRFETRFSNQDITHTRPTDQLFTGDFNGDGMTDILKYDKVSDNNLWNIHYSKGMQFSQGFRAYKLNNTELPEHELYSYSIRKVIAYPNLPTGLSYGICPADFDGDGITDIATLKYTSDRYSSIEIYFRFAPNWDDVGASSFQATFESGRYNGIYGPHGGDAYYFGCHSQYLHIGTFTKKGTASFLCLEYRDNNNIPHPWKRRPGVFTFKSARDLNNVESITDGMGNKLVLNYQWQMQSYQKYQHGVVRLAVPMHVIDGHTTYTKSGKPRQVRYGYYDLCYHKDGHGFLGYRRTVRTDVENGEKVGQTVSCASLEPMNEFAMLLPSNDSVFVYLNENKVLSNTTRYTFRRAFESSSEGLKAGCPALLKKQTKHFNIDDGGSFLYREIKEYSYNFTVNVDIHNYSYYYLAYACDTTRTGISANYVSQVADCEFRTTERVVYSQNDYSNWIINRPEKRTVVQSMADKPDIVKTTVIDYHPSNKTYLPNRITEIPSEANFHNPLTLQTDYEYFANGYLKKETLSAPFGQLGEQPRSTIYEYGPDKQQRLLTKETLKSGTFEYETSYDYDLNDNLFSTTDCNDLITRHDEDALGITRTITLADNTNTCCALRWANDADYAPEGASYYRWERKTGHPKNLVFYHKSGLELRRVTFGLRNEPVFVDKTYDNRDRLCSVTNPYKEGETLQYTVFEYDNINRIVAQTTPDGTRTEYHYDGLSTTTDIVPTEGIAQSSTVTKNPAGWIKSSTDASNVTINYDYYADGTLAYSQVGSNAASRIEMQYDPWGNRTLLHDPDYCTEKQDLISVYNAYGELVSEETPKRDRTKYNYDQIGRLISFEDFGEGTTTYYDYDESPGRKGTLQRIRHGDQTIIYLYDEFLRVVNTTEIWNGIHYHTYLGYDRASRVCSLRYPSGYTALFEYTPSGHANKITDAAGNLLWQLDDMNARGQMLQATLGNGLVTRHTYTDDMHYIDSIITSNNLQNLSYHYDKFGNLAARKDNKRNLMESFTYDEMNRLKTITMGSLTASMTYDNLGRMTGKQAIMTGKQVPQVKQVFAAPEFDATKIHAMVEATAEQGVFPPMDQNISYTSFDKVKYLGEGKNRLTYLYGFNRQRIDMRENKAGRVRDKIYIGNCEFVNENGKQKTLTYLTGPYGVFAVVEQQNGEESVHFVLKDHLGSWTTITDANGNVEREQSYDAWGNMRNPETWLNYSAYEPVAAPMFDRGFTGHEHMTAFGLINMNGRCYDPVTSSFLSVDRFVQSPDNSQGFNRYAYCMYNPLRYIDPSGWLPGKLGNSPDDPPRLNNYRPGTYYSADPEYAWLVRLDEVEVSATSLGHDINNKGTNYTEGTTWAKQKCMDYTWNGRGTYSSEYSGGEVYISPTTSSGGGGGGGIGMGANNQFGNSKLTPSVVNYVATGAGTITGYQKSLWEKPKSRAQKAINQKKAYETQKALKQKGITKSVKEIKASKITNLSKASNVLGIVGLASTGVDVAFNNGIAKPSHVMDLVIGVACLSPAGWIIGASYLAVDIGSYAITGQSIGSNVNNWCGGVGVDLKTFSIVY